MVRIVITSPSYFELEVDQNTAVKFTKQINDVLDIGYQKSSYTNSFKIPMTSNNVKALGLLGVRGNDSEFPYRKIGASLIVNEIPLIQNGWLSITNSSNGYYNCNIIDGVIDLFKYIENKNIGDLDLQELNHRKTVQEVKNRSVAGGNVVYILGAFGGSNTMDYQLNGSWQKFIDIDYQVPSVSKLFLLKKIFDFAGFDLLIEGGETIEMKEDYITFPQEPTNAFVPIQYFTGSKTPFTSVNTYLEGSDVRFIENWIYDTYNVVQGNLINGWRYKAPVTGKYSLKVNINGKAIYQYFGSQNVNLIAYVRQSNSFGYQIQEIPVDEDYEFVYESILPENGEIWIEFGTKYRSGYKEAYSMSVQTLDVEIDIVGSGDVNFNDVFKDYTMKGFVKEFFLKYGLIPIVDGVLNTVVLKTIDSLLNVSNSKDLSKFYIGHSNEVYTLANYARRNLVKYKYNEGDSSLNDGLISINNENLQDERIIYQTALYSPLSGIQTINTRFNGVNTSFESFVYPIWRAEPKEVETDGVKSIEIEYKPLNNRFYEIKSKQMNFSTYLVSRVTGERTNINAIQVADINNSLLVETIPREYEKWEKVLNNFEMLTAEFNMSTIEATMLDLTIPYYIDVLGAYYIINKIESSNNGVAKADIIKVNL